MRPPLSPAEAGGFGPDPVRELLQTLRGREVVLQVGTLLHRGRILSTDPLMLVDPEGRATLIRLEAVQAVEF